MVVKVVRVRMGVSGEVWSVNIAWDTNSSQNFFNSNPKVSRSSLIADISTTML